MKTPSRELVLSRLEYSPETGVFVWKENAGRSPQWNARFAGKEAGSQNQKGYVQIKIDGRLHMAHKLAWLVTHGAWPSGIVDHKNRVSRDNSIDNLRLATHGQNAANAKCRKDNRSGHKGVFKREYGFSAAITVEKRVYRLGFFKRAEDAARAYAEAAAKFHGEFACSELSDGWRQGSNARSGMFGGR